MKRGEFRTYPDWLHYELMNWARWSWSGAYPHPIPPATCASYEKNYRRTGEEEEARNERQIKPNADNAQKVQAVWDALPHWPQQVLRAEYPQRHESGRVEHGRAAAARWLGISLEHYESALSVAAHKVMVAFEGDL